MDNVKQIIKSNRPKLSDSSVKTYGSILSNLSKKITEKSDVDTEFFFKKVKEILEHLKDCPSSKRKTILAALVVLTEKDEKVADQYRKLMLDDKNVYDEDQKNQKVSDSQRENWVSQQELKDLYDRMDKENRPLLSRDSLKDAQLQQLQNFIILALYYLQPPRRLKDYTEMKMREVDEKTDNFIKANNLVFNVYKTAKTHGQETVPLNPKLKFILNRWKILNTNPYLLISSLGKKLTSSQLQQRLNAILGKKASVNILRHSFLTEKYKDVPAIRELQERADAMGHTVEQALLYVKQDAPPSTPPTAPPSTPPQKKVRTRTSKK